MLDKLRFLGNLEGVSYLLLLGVAMPLKYIFEYPIAVKITGMAHGVLFVAYTILLLVSKFKFKWSFGFSLYLFVATLVPFGTFVTDRKLKSM